MSTTPAEAMQDAATPVREVEIGCSACGECWTVYVRDGEDVTYDDTVCLIAGCDGEGEEV